MSSIEETLQRIKSTEGVQGFVIVDQNGGILRKSDSFSDEVSTQNGALIDDLTRMAMGAVRDLDPTSSLEYLRLRSAKHEILVAPRESFTVIVLQEWSQASN
mmetsp:Transcript_34268/g.50378  ORF Transcript_34268/g.50378 Transcript_34268/m.50378 type:complete len:102 (-) Transcript_34268:92-397(-)|eukprot:CAMPEP_0195532678 /NCGR_PEP_ID=MMETSP0794_2-20130614/38860_1 /TAXON_ID=515487 /ORGANISM="Stephanopyxis turris, Strain CCMP 815" /LENGTH=101 /DNA_ID=CAMNT_0040665005 /DNA_START=28 /DNA_END=333 /DNA_ORIENTATION=+